MSDDAFRKPDADVRIDADIAARLLSDQLPSLAGQPVSIAGEGWDNVTVRIGSSYALRLPRRASADALVRKEQRWLPGLAPDLPLPIPVPLRSGTPTAEFPFHWSLVPWLEGEPADIAPPGAGSGPVLAGFLLALHDIPLPETPPSNPVRDCPLSQKDADFHRRFAEVEARFPGADRMKAFWSQCCEIANADSPCWVAGDLHAGNVLVDTGTISAVIDWGDMCAGDPAVDLGSVWTVLPDRQERLAAVELYAPHKDLLRRAAGWALYFSVVKIQTGVGRSERDVASGREGYMRLLSDLDAPTLSVLLGQG